MLVLANNVDIYKIFLQFIRFETNPSKTTTNLSYFAHDFRYPVPELQLVTARTRQLEEARGGCERRTEVARSELARLSTTRLEPSVALRRKEFETRTARREARSLDVQPQGKYYVLSESDFRGCRGAFLPTFILTS